MLTACNYHEAGKDEGRLNGVQGSSELEMAGVFYVRKLHRIGGRVGPSPRLKLLKICCCYRIQGLKVQQGASSAKLTSGA